MESRIASGIVFALAFAAAPFAVRDASAQAYGAQVSVVAGDPAPLSTGSAPAATHEIASPFDQRLADRVAGELSADPALQGAVVTIRAKDGNVALTGSTIDTTQSDRIQQVATAIAGVGHVSANLSTARP